MRLKVRPAFVLGFSIFIVLVGVAACKSSGSAPGSGGVGGGASEANGTTFFPRIGQ